MRKRASSEIDHVLRGIAEKQLGLITVGQAAALGVGAQPLAYRRSIGMLVPVFPRVMRLRGVEPPPHQLALAAALAVSGSCIAGPTAGAILGLPVGKPYVRGLSVGPVVLSVPNSTVVRARGIVAVRLRILLPSRPWMGARIATPAAALTLLPRYLDASIVERCLDHCLAHRLVTVATVRALIESQPRRSVMGRALLLDLLASRAGGIGHRSMKEQGVGRWLDAAGLGGWRRNYVVVTADGTRIEVDFAWVEFKIVLEVSPFFTHGSQATQERDVIRRGLLVEMGWTVVEATDSDLTGPVAFERVVRLLRQRVH
jgi:hypothetical protein